MKILVDVKEEKAAFIMELLDNFKFVKTKPISPYKADWQFLRINAKKHSIKTNSERQPFEINLEKENLIFFSLQFLL